MNKMYLKLLVKAQNLMNNEEGQDLVEYALLVALLSVGAVASTRLVATAITTQFSAIAGAIS
jgi:pilus assembly protein Flp/PilA